MFFHDDGLLMGTLKSLAWAARLFDELSPISGLKMKWMKTKCYAPGIKIASRYRKLLPSEAKVSSNLNFKFLKAPIGTDYFVKNTIGR